MTDGPTFDPTEPIAPEEYTVENEHGVSMADLTTTLRVLHVLSEEYLHESETFPDTVDGVQGTLQAYEVATTWLNTGFEGDRRQIRLSFSELCACTSARQYEQTGWDVVEMEWSDASGLLLTFEMPDDLAASEVADDE